MHTGTKTIEEYEKESVLGYNFDNDEFRTFQLLGIRTMGDLLRRHKEVKGNDIMWQTIRKEAARLGFG